tara:strand:+ start:667 stop:960 length:294 start_codon:yes stop_codon:yes gene_type:complete
MSINDATPEEWDEVTRKLRKEKTYGDDVDSPFHYNKGSIECVDAIEAASTKEEFEGYVRANVLKYVWRFRYKDNIKDLKKARWYLDKLIDSLMKPEE